MIKSDLEQGKVNLKLFKLSGFWQILSKDSIPWLAVHAVPMAYFILYMQMVQLARLLLDDLKLEDLVERFVCIATYIDGTVKIIYFLSNRKLARHLTAAFQKDFLLCSKFQSDSRSFNNGLEWNDLVCNFHCVLLINTLFIWSATPVIQCIFFKQCHSLQVLPTWFPFDQSESRFKILAFLLDSATVAYNALVLFTINTFMLITIVMICAQMQQLKDVISNIRPLAEDHVINMRNVKNIQNSMTSNVDLVVGNDDLEREVRDKMDELLKVCLNDHQKMLRTIGLTEKLYSPVNLFQMIISSVMICSVVFVLIIPFAITSKRGDKGVLDIMMKHGVKYCFFCTDAIMELGIFSFCGFLISEQTKSMHKVFYNSDWQNASNSYKKNVLIATTRAVVPLTLTAGKFYIVDLQSFASIMKISYSYLMLLYGIVSKRQTEFQM